MPWKTVLGHHGPQTALRPRNLCLSQSGRGPGVAGSKRGCQVAGEVAMSARGKTLVPLLVVVAAVALQSTYLQVEPVDSEKPGELPWGYSCGIGTSDRQMGK